MDYFEVFDANRLLTKPIKVCAAMDKYDFKSQCKNPTQQLSIQIPCRLAERVEAHASKTGGSITNVVIEALDIFLRENQHQD